MRCCGKGAVAVLLATWMASSTAQGQGGAVDLLSALQAGQVWAEFRGAGDTAVTGVVGRNGPGPQQLIVPSGTQFLAQRPGVQGMSVIGSVPIDLGEQHIASVYIPTACTNIGLATPTTDDIMFAAACPDERLARLAVVLDKAGAPHPATQLAVWAVANNPQPWLIQMYLRQVCPGESPDAAQARGQLLMTAAELLAEAGLDPSQFAMFW